MNELLNFVLAHEQFRKARLPSLYSDFRYLRTTNPNGFAANLTAWKAVLRDASKRNLIGDGSEKLVLNSNEELIAQLATKEWGRPLALGAVVDEAVATREWIPLNQFLAQRESVYYRSWAGALVSWGLERVGLKSPAGAALSERRLVTGKYVLVKNVEDAAKDVLQQVSARPSRVGRIYSTEHFAKEFVPSLSSTDLQILIKFLSRDLHEATSDGKIIKFRSPNEELSAITEQDTSIAQLKALISSLHTRVDSLGVDITTCNNKARAAVAVKNRMIAMAALKSKKTAESALSTIVKALGQVEEVLVRIEQAADNVELVRQLECSAKVLKGLNAEVGGAERVDEVMDGLKQETEEVDEIARILGEASTAPVVDDAEVEDELNTMLQMEQDTAKLPEQPQRQPSPDKIIDETLSRSLEDIQLGGNAAEQKGSREDGNTEKTNDRETAEPITAS